MEADDGNRRAEHLPQVAGWTERALITPQNPATTFQGTSMTTEREVVKLPSGVSLEAKLHSPEAPTSEGSAGLAVLLHPWSWLGGRMEDQCELPLIVSTLNLKN